MLNLLRNFLFLVFLISSQSASATLYYLSSAGSDAADGTTPATAWQTITHLNNQISAMQPGDQILLRRGDTFRGGVELYQNGSAGAPITMGAYGTGALPVISGAELVTGWALYSGNIYRASVPRSVSGLYANGKRMALARFPNSGWLFVDAGIGNSGLTDAGITQPNGYWSGGRVHVRTVDWEYEIRDIQSHINTTITFQNATDYGTSAGWGYFLDNKLAALDAPGEWYYDVGAGQLYFYAPGGINPASMTVEAVVQAIGIEMGNNSSYLTIENLRIEKFSRNGVRLLGTSEAVIVRNCEVSQTGETALHFETDPATGLRIIGNTISDAEGRGIYVYGADEAEISGNTLNRIGMVPGYGLSEVSNGVGILCYEGTTNSLISGNSIDSTGYAGIRIDGSYNVVEYNRIANAVLVLSDAGGFYCYGTDTHHNTIQHNWIQNVVGNVETSPNDAFSMGIYIDNFSSYITVHNNVVTGARNFGILNNFDTHHNTYTDNLTYGNGSGGLMMDDRITAVGVGNQVTGNTFYCLGEDEIPMRLIAEYANPNWGTFDNNAYYNPYSCVALETKYDYGSGFEWRYYSLPHWQSASGQDANSRQSIVNWNTYETTAITGADLVSNPNFDANINGWGNWPGNNTINWTNAAGLDNGALRFTMTSTSPQPNGLTHTPGFAFTAGAWYELSFSTRGVNYGHLRLDGRETVGYTNIEFSRTTTLLAGARKDERMTFQMPTSYAQARMDFEADFSVGGFNLDNVHLYPVEVEWIDPEMRSRLFVNHTAAPRSITFQDTSFTDQLGNPVSALTLAPWSASVLLFASASVTLPIELLYFETDCKEGQPLLKWALVDQGGDEKLLVERSVDGQSWEVLESLNKDAAENLVWQDPRPLSIPAYYRLRVLNSESQSQIFAPVLADCSRWKVQSIQVFPNPVAAGAPLRITAPEGTTIRLTTLSGQIMGEWSDPVSAAQALQARPPQPGIYILHSPLAQPFKLVVY